MSSRHIALGKKVDKLTVRLYYGSPFSTAINARTEWTVAPRLMFNDDEDDVWEGTIDPADPKRVIFMESVEKVNARFSGEKAELWESDRIMAAGQVTMYDRP